MKSVLWVILWIGITGVAWCQGLTINGATLYVEGAGSVTVEGDIEIKAAPAVLVYGEMSLTGDWINNANFWIMEPSSGSVKFLGTTEQRISGSSDTHFPTLDVSGTGDVVLDVNVQVGGTSSTGGLALNSTGSLSLNMFDISLVNPTAGGISGVGTGGIISETDPDDGGYGHVIWEMGSPELSVYSVPFQTLSGENIPLTMEFTNPGAGNGTFALATYSTNPIPMPNNRPLPVGVQSTVDWDGFENSSNCVDRWWIIEPSGFSLEPTAHLTLTYDNAALTGSNSIAEAQLQTQRNDGSVWSQPPQGVADASTNTVLALNQSEWSYAWTLVNSFALLPIELGEFSVRANGANDVLCEWTTLTELNNDFFTVERSSSLENFEPVGTIDGAGNSLQPLNYLFHDRNPLKGWNYYRLRQTDFSGQSSVSEIRAVWLQEILEPSMVLAPNPMVDGTCHLIPNISEETEVTLECLGPLGQSVYEPQRIMLQPNVSFPLNWGRLSAGSYLLSVEASGWTRTLQFIVE